ncbi:hypothetical protein E2C01_047019 [Portunus trituberculatus]|uniref:Uncharacterized protein n=1 Tax=Portunus trituberculatus TaxID=210409 RepID=A0A5B7G9C5_PORTR|nr:hypothetical protein [Portunus trituberculatus]
MIRSRVMAACGRECRNVAAAWEQAGSHSRATRTPALRLVPVPATPRHALPLHLAPGALFLHPRKRLLGFGIIAAFHCFIGMCGGATLPGGREASAGEGGRGVGKGG